MFFYRFSPFCSGEKNMQKATPVKEVCNVAPSGLMTPRDAAVYIGVKINTLAVWRMTNGLTKMYQQTERNNPPCFFVSIYAVPYRSTTHLKILKAITVTTSKYLVKTKQKKSL